MNMDARVFGRRENGLAMHARMAAEQDEFQDARACANHAAGGSNCQSKLVVSCSAQKITLCGVVNKVEINVRQK